MKVKMLEHYQDAQVHYLPDQEVDTSAALGAWLVEHRKAVKLEVVQRSTPEQEAEFVKALAESEESPDAVKPEMDEQGGMVIPEKAQIKRGRVKK